MYPALDQIELPPSVQQALAEMRRPQEEARLKQIEALTEVLLKKRQAAIDGRRESGIEEIWSYCEDAYIGIDESNRHEFTPNRWYKLPGMNAGLEREGTKVDDSRSTIFIPMTRRYVNAGAAKVISLATSPDERPFSIEPTPVPELVRQSKDTRPYVEDGVPLQRDQTPRELNPGSSGTPEHPLPIQEAPAIDPSQAPGKPLTYADLARETMQRASEAAEAAGKRMQDWMVECHFTRVDRRCIGDAARLGVGIIKGPVLDLSRSVVASRTRSADGTNAIAIQVREEIKPVAKHVSPWKFYPDPSCGEEVQNGGFTWEEDDLSRASLQQLAALPGYDQRAIAQILKEDPKRVGDDRRRDRPVGSQGASLPYQIWYLYGTVTRAEFDAMLPTMNGAESIGLDDRDEVERALTDVPIQAAIINDRIIQLIPQPLRRSGAYPYHIFNWLTREGFWAGIGVGEQGMAAQRIINAGARREFENAGYTAGMQIIVNQDLIEPSPVRGQPNNWKIQPIKFWRTKRGVTVDDIRKAMHTVQFPNAHAQLVWVIEFGIRIFEEVTNIPLVTQGWSGKTTPDTARGTEIQDSNANQMLRDVTMNHDFALIPFVRQLYEYLLLDPTVPDEEKGDVQILPRVSTALLDRYLQKQAFVNYLPMIMQNHRDFEVSPKKVFEEVWRAERLNPQSIQYTDEERKALANQQPPEPPEVTVAKMRGQIEMDKNKMQHEYNVKELELRERIADKEFQVKLLEYASHERISLEQAKKDLAKTAMQLKTQKEISLQSVAVKQVATPGTEPPGRAPAGEAFQK